MIKHQDEILLPAVSSDRTAVPRYDVVAPDGQTIYEDVALKLANDVAQPGTPINKPLLDEFLAASGITAGSATAYTLAQEGYSLFDGASVRFRLHTASGGNATLNINGTGAKPLRDVLGETMNEGIPAGTWLTATYSAAAGAYIIMSGGVKRSIDEAINGEQYTVDDAVGYVKDVPEKVLPYAEISKIGGMTYKDGNTLRSAAVTEVESVGANLIDLKDVPIAGNYVFDVPIEVTEGEYCLSVFNSDGTTDGWRRGSNYSAHFMRDNEYIVANIENFKVVTKEQASRINRVRVNIAPDRYTGTSETLVAMLNHGSTALPYTPYFRDTLTIPEAVRALDGYGESNPDDATEYNAIKWLADGKRIYSHKGNIVNDAWVALAAEEITDISSLLPVDNILRVQPGGMVTPINEFGYAVPSTITYQRNVLNNRASTFEVEKVRAQQNGITVTLAAGAWSGNTQTIAVPGVTADNTVICSPDPASHDAYGKYGVYCISQADGQLTFRCKRTPDTALAVNIIAMGG